MTLKIRSDALLSSAYVYLTLPVLIFFIGWLRPIVGIPAAVILIAGVAIEIISLKKTAKKQVYPLNALCIAAGIILLWCIVSGQGGLYYQTNDWHWRNAIFRDLITFSWPVVYPDHYGLVYYIAHWLPASLVGKLLGWHAGNIALLCWTFLGVCITFLLLIQKLSAFTLKKIMFVLAVLIFFSGLDALALFMPNSGISCWVSLEWWDKLVQYSSNTTQLMWVFNQAIPAWVATALLLNRQKISSVALITLLALPFSPLPIFGLAVIAAAITLRNILHLIKAKKIAELFKSIFSPQNLSAVITILPIYFFFYLANLKSGSQSHDLAHSYLAFYGFSKLSLIKILLPFYLFEFLIYSFIISKRYIKNYLFIVINILLILIPFFKVGNGADFAMRASIPPLFVLMCFVIRFIFEEKAERKKYSICALAALAALVIGAITPVVEQANGIATMRTQHKINAVADDIKTISGKDYSSFSNFLAEDTQNAFFYRHLAKRKT